MISGAADAERFWELVGFEERFPRNLEHLVALALPVSIVRLPRLTPRTVVDWLERVGVHWEMSVRARALRGCMIAHRGHGMIFVDGSLEPNEVRFTVAHETAHFLRHYAWRRELAVASLGESIVPVLDGDRSPTPAEQLSGILKGVPVGPCSHLLDRSADGLPNLKALDAETEADLLAFELLAPAKSVLGSTARGESRRLALEADYGLPAWAADLWGRHLDARTADTSFMARLRKAAEKT